MSEASGGFDEALSLEVAGDGHLVGDIMDGWDVRGNPHGGYLLALAGRAMARVVDQPDPLTISATYLAPPRMGSIDLHVDVVRLGRRQSTAAVRMIQDGVERVRAMATFGELPDEAPEVLSEDASRPVIPPPEACLEASVLERAEGEPINLHERLELRFHPDTGWVFGRPRGRAELHGWLRIADGRPTDVDALLLFSDGLPPTLFEARGREIGHVPTVQLTTHLFARPDPGWVQGAFRSRVRGGAFVDEDGELWDSTGRLVGTARQLALIRPPA